MNFLQGSVVGGDEEMVELGNGFWVERVANFGVRLR